MVDHKDLDERLIAPVPRVTVQAFCETGDVGSLIESASNDRRMMKAHVKVQMGGAAAAVEAYRVSPTPNLIILESNADRGSLIAHLETLSQVCDAGTKVIVIGHVNDVILFRELTRRGVSDYLVHPVTILDLVATISELFTTPGSEPIGRTIAVVGAKGGVGSSTISHNIAWAASRHLDLSTVVVDLDIAFGTAGLDYNQDPPQGIADAIFVPDRIDEALIDRLLSKCSDNLNLLAAPASLDRTCDLAEMSLDNIIDILRTSMACIVMDVPHLWTAWVKRVPFSADVIVIVSGPDLAGLRNTKNFYDLIGAGRPNDKKPLIILNQVGVPKRPEISVAEFSKALGAELGAVIPFDAQLFGTAANNGQMIAEVQPNGATNMIFQDLAARVTGRQEMKRPRGGLFDPILARLTKLKAS